MDCGQLVDKRKRGTESVNWRSRWFWKVGCVREWVNIIEILHPAGKSCHDTEHIHLQQHHHCNTTHEHSTHRLTETQARPDRQRATTSHLWRRPTKKQRSESEDTALRGMTAFLAFLQTLRLPHSTNHAPSTHNKPLTFLSLSSSSQGTPEEYNALP